MMGIGIGDALPRASMAAWGGQQGAAGKIMMLSDPRAESIKTIGLDLDLTDFLAKVPA